jgi:hypothetical protein
MEDFFNQEVFSLRAAIGQRQYSGIGKGLGYVRFGFAHLGINGENIESGCRVRRQGLAVNDINVSVAYSRKFDENSTLRLP